MRTTACAAIAILAIGCGASPTAPSANVSPASVVADQAARPTSSMSGSQKVTLFFDGHGLPIDSDHQVGHDHLVGLAVTLVGTNTLSTNSTPMTYLLVTGRQATVTAEFPKSYNHLSVTWDPQNGWCGGAREISLPIRSAPGEPLPDWIVVNSGC